MASKPINKMPIEMRAKQFAPFAALKGFEEAIAAKEHIIIERPELSEDQLAMLDYKLTELSTCQMVTIVYYSHEFSHYTKITGLITKIDESDRSITVVSTRISCDDIIDITL